MSAPRLGELAVAAGACDPARLEELLALQRRNAALGDFRRLGELLAERLNVPRPRVRALLRQQGLELVACELCETRHVHAGPPVGAGCVRCGRRLVACPDDAPLSTEDTVGAPALVAAQRARNPRFGRWEVLGEIGRGGMGVVHKAWDPQLARPVALKFLRHAEKALREDVKRFRREARAIAALRHENIVGTHGVFEADRLTCVVLDYVPGLSLATLLARRVLELGQILRALVQVARALHHAHQAGIVHRDVKPENIMIAAATGRPYLIDFGVAKDQNESVSLTLEGGVVGTLAYMAPEYLSQGVAGVSPACDVYALGVILYEVFTGGLHPFGRDDGDARLARIVTQAPTPVAQADPRVPAALAAVIDRAVARTPAARTPSAEELARELEALV